MRRFLPAGLILVVACSDDGSDPNEPVDIQGSWTFTASVSNSELDITCEASGGLSITQSGDQFSGTVSNGEGTCTSPAGPLSFDPSGAIGGGTITDEDQIEFSDDFCTYTGQATGNPATEVQGDASCVFNIGGQDIPMEGTWQLER